MNKSINFVAFLLGLGVGSLVTWKYIKKKYEKITQQEIDSVKETFSKKKDTIKKKQNEGKEKGKEKEPKATNNSSLDNAVVKMDNQKNHDYTSHYAKEETVGITKFNNAKLNVDASLDGKKNKGVYIISPEQFGDVEDYDTISLSLYKDKVLADENDELIADIDGLVGMDSLNHFGEYEDDSVFIRNDVLKSDFEILRDERNYSDLLKRKPHEL